MVEVGGGLSDEVSDEWSDRELGCGRGPEDCMHSDEGGLGCKLHEGELRSNRLVIRWWRSNDVGAGWVFTVGEESLAERRCGRRRLCGRIRRPSRRRRYGEPGRQDSALRAAGEFHSHEAYVPVVH
ncbi:hypothetical protein L1887_21325 [Cichorium endivia]|nr:hypothetical protein L1887_21325 [Cichorium endivia]